MTSSDQAVPGGPALQVEGLAVRLGDFQLRDVSLKLDPGGYMVLLGPSGCGKTTLLQAVAGLHGRAQGVVRLGGRDVSGMPPHKRRVGYVAQAVDLFPHLNVERNVAFGLQYCRLSRAEKRGRLQSIADLLGLAQLMPRMPGTLSGGEGKRVALARSLVIEPEVLLLDEPLSMLDHNARLAMLETLRSIHNRMGTATIHVTHDRQEAWTLGTGHRLAGRCAVMRDGTIEQVGPAGDLFRKPRTRFVAEFLGGANVLPARFVRRGTTWRALLGWAELDVPGPVAFTDGWLQLRPESLVPAEAGTAGALHGTVVSSADRGVYRQLTVRVAPQVIVEVHVVAADAPAAGEAIHLKLAAPPHPIPGDRDA